MKSSSLRSLKIFSVLLFVVYGIASFLFFPSCYAQYARREMANEYTEEMDQQLALVNAQSTLASLFGKHAVLAVPPQLAGGTIALPAGESPKMKVNSETVAEDTENEQ